MRKDDSGVSEHSTSRFFPSYENFLVAGLFKKELTESKFPSTKKCRRSSFPVRPSILNPLALVQFAAGAVGHLGHGQGLAHLEIQCSAEIMCAPCTRATAKVDVRIDLTSMGNGIHQGRLGARLNRCRGTVQRS
jgi:hypothetical protein